MRRSAAILCGALGGLMLAASIGALAHSRASTPMRDGDADGVPVTLYGSGPHAATIVLVHGFAGSRRSMDVLARGLSGAGFTAITMDLAGHGGNTESLPLTEDAAPMTALVADVSRVVDWARLQPEVDADGVALLGSSIGAGAAIAYAVAHPQVRASVTLSLPSAGGLPAGEAATPRNLLLLFGGRDESRFADAALDGLRTAYPDGVVGTTYGDPAAGTARRADAIPWAGHLGVAYAPATLAAATSWLAAAMGVTVDGDGSPVAWLAGWLAVAAIGGGLVLAAVAQGVLGAPRARSLSPVPATWAIGNLYVSGLMASMIAAALAGRTVAVLPLAVGAFLALWFTVCALVAAAGVLAWTARVPRGHRRAPFRLRVTPRSLVGAVLALAATVAALAIPAALTWSSVTLTAQRVWILVAMIVIVGAWLTIEERLVDRVRVGSRIALVAASRGIVVAMLIVAVRLFGAPGFLSLLMPVLAVVLVVLAAYGTVVARGRDGWLASVLVQAVPLALLTATWFPLVTT